MGWDDGKINERISLASQITTESVENTKDFVALFKDIQNIIAPIFYVSPPPPYTPKTQLPGKAPEKPDDARITSASKAIGKIDGAISGIDQFKQETTDPALSKFQDLISGVQGKMSDLRNAAKSVAIPTASDFFFSEGDPYKDNDLDTELRKIIISEIAKDGEGLPDAAEAAAYDIDRERREIERQDAIDAALDEQAGRGFSRPQGYHLAAVQAINEKFRTDDRGLSRDIMIKQSGLSLENKYRAIDAGISYNQMQIAFADAQAQRALEAVTETLGLYLTGIRFGVNSALAQLSVSQAEAGAVLDDKRNLLDVYSSKLILVGKKIDGLLAKSRGYVSAYRTDGQVYAEGIATADKESRYLQGEQVLSLEYQKASIMAGLSAVKNALTSFIETTNIQLGAGRAQAGVYLASARGLLNSLGTVVQVLKSGEQIMVE